MGILIPEDFPLSTLKNDEERIVVEALRDRLTDGWMIIPDVGLAGDRDRQMDIVIAHELEGIAVIEVKGHTPTIRNGIWYAHGSPMEPQPLQQASGNAYALRDRLRAIGPELSNLYVEYGVAFPNALEVTGQLPPSVKATQILTSRSLEDPQDAIEHLISARWGTRLGPKVMQAIITTLRPDVDFTWDPEARARLARMRLEQICGQHVRVLERLDQNRKVVVTGGAGTGKTRLAMAWTRRAMVRGERVLLTCYNDPLGEAMRRRLPEQSNLSVDSFLKIALELDGMPELEVPEDADSTFWEYDVVGHLHKYWHLITQRFDTIVIDEAQDFSPAWIAQLTQLLDPEGPSRLLMVADESQGLYRRGFTMPRNDDGWTRCELINNCRNTSQIANMLRRHLGGAPPPVGGPEAEGITWLASNTLDEAALHVGNEIDRVVDGEGHDPTRVLVATMSRAVRDRLRADFAFVSCEGGEPATIICETVHRVKGLEFDYVILVVTDEDTVNDQLLYIGCSRAIAGLSVIAPVAVGERLGLC